MFGSSGSDDTGKGVSANSRFAVSRAQVFLFCLTGAPQGVTNWILYSYVTPYYERHIGVSLASIGTAFLVARLWDVVGDLLMGYLVDRVGLGRYHRRLWCAVQAPLFFVATYFLFFPQPHVGPFYFFFSVLGFQTANTLYLLASAAWTATLSGDYVGRANIQSIKIAIAIAVQIGAQAALIIAAWPDGPHDESVMATCGILGMVLVVLTTVPAVLLVPEADVNKLRGRHLDLFRTTREMLKNKLLLWFMAANCLGAVADVFHDNSIYYIAEIRLGLPHKVTYIFVAQQVIALLLSPFLGRAVKTVSKHRLLAISLGVQMLSFALVFSLAKGELVGALLVYALYGVGQLAWWSLPHVVVADIADVGRLTTGLDQTGQFVGALEFVQKIGLALAASASTFVLSGFSFSSVAPDGGPNGHTALVTVGLVLPIVFAIPAFALLWRLPLTQRRYAIVRRVLSENREGLFRACARAKTAR